MSELIHHILDVSRPFGAIRQALCGEAMPRDDIRLGQQVEICQACVRVRRERRSRR